MAKIKKDAFDATLAETPAENGVQRQVMVYDVPKAWISAIKNGAHTTMSSYMKAALLEKLQRDGHL